MPPKTSEPVGPEQRPTALVVEGDDRMMSPIEDALNLLGHVYHRTRNHLEAKQMLEQGRYDYVLLDMTIPATANSGEAEAEFGMLLLEEIRRMKGKRVIPTIVIVDRDPDCLELIPDMLERGVADFVLKPFPRTGRTLSAVIRKVFSNRPIEQTETANGSRLITPQMPRPFTGGDLVFFKDRVTLLGIKIISDMGTGQSIMVLRELSCKVARGRYPHRSAEELVDAIQSRGVGTITSCIRTLRNNATERLRKHLNIECGKNDFIGHDDQGYQLREWIGVWEAKEETAGGNGIMPTRDSSLPTAEARFPPGPSVLSLATGGLNQRQKWALQYLARFGKLERTDLEKQFNVRAKTAKRDLAELIRRGLVEFVRMGRSGYYRLKRVFGDGKR